MHRMPWLRVALLVLVTLQLCHAAQKGASVTLRARWRGTPYLLEAAEFLAEEDKAHYWKFVENWASEPSSETSCWDAISESASSLLTSGVIKVMQLVLASRQYSAKLEMYRQLANQTAGASEGHCCWVDLNGRTISDAAVLAAAVEEAAQQAPSGSNAQLPQLFSFDHIYKSDGSTAGAVKAVLYASPGTACFAEMHAVLAAAATKHSAAPGTFLYAHRPVLMDSCQASRCATEGSEEQLVLPGWGVELALKNTEYSAMDDKKQAAVEGAAADAAPDSGAELGEAKGFLLDTLVARKPHLRQELLTFRDHLMAVDDEESLKVWDLKDTGLQATQRILAASDPLALLTDLSQNFPGLVSSLSREPVGEALRANVLANSQLLMGVGNSLMLNGLPLDVNNLDLYKFLERLRSEVRVADSVAALQLQPRDAAALLAARSEDKTDSLSEVRLDLSPMTPHVLFLNDLENDKAYQRFGSSLMELLNTFPGRLRPIARNVFNAVYILDPSAPGTLTLPGTLMQMYQGFYPIRMGVLPIVAAVVERLKRQAADPWNRRPANPEWPAMDDSERLARALLMMRSAFGAAAPFRLWAAYAAEGESKPESTALQRLEAALKSSWKQEGAATSGLKARTAAKKSPEDAWLQLQSGSGYASEVGMELTELTQFAMAKGVAELESPTLWLNGQMQPVGAAPDQELMYRTMYEQQAVQEWIYFNHLTDEGNTLSSILTLGKAVACWNPAILNPAAAGNSSRQVVLVEAVRHPVLRSLQYLYRPGALETTVKPVTQLVVADLVAPEGRKLLAEAMRFLEDFGSAAATRVAWLSNPADLKRHVSLVEVVVEQAIKRGSPAHKVPGYLRKLLEDTALCMKMEDPAPDADGKALEVALKYAADAKLDEQMKAGIFAAISSATHQMGAALEKGKDVGSAAQWMKHDTEQAGFARTVLGLAPGSSAVVTNGRLFIQHVPGGAPQPLVAEDLSLLSLVAHKFMPGEAVGKAVKEALKGGRLPARGDGTPATAREASDLAMAALSMFGTLQHAKEPAGGQGGPSRTSKQVMEVISQITGTTVEIPAEDGPGSALSIVAVLNPLTRAAQRLSAVLKFVRDVMRPAITLHLTPQHDLSDMPLKAFYRYALPELGISQDGSMQAPGTAAASFSRLPGRRVLTLNMDVPEAWLVEPVEAAADLDNLRLADVPGRMVTADFELEALMLTGACTETQANGRNKGPPRGLQMYLGTGQQPHLVDTLVMANLGYFQLKAAPGLWMLSLAPGRSRKLYRLQASTGAVDASGETPEAVLAAGEFVDTTDDRTTQVVLASLSGKYMVLKVTKRAGYENDELLDATAEEDDAYGEEDEEEGEGKGGMWGAVKSLFGGAKHKAAASTALAGGAAHHDDVVNVFTVASGHMYERLQKIMFLSVIKNTKSRVKFWLIKNYMSPQHKRVIPAMAAEYGFDYEFVTYKWPHWLHKQTDKQRIIWAYKILFLDVLFPLDVKRIIFVDSDQVVRTDLKELYDMDLKGAPLAYTPFCDNNKDMDEYRFWKGGFWASHLAGRPYHISALYLVDLQRFRLLAAGDQYRVVYEQLSKDPNSLANLDQDLPNYAQHSIPIHSLSSEWLWCESWCGNETKAKARTIDLCNNPRTKEPKLQAARRIIAEWPAYDEEVARFTQSVLDGFEEEGAAPPSTPAAPHTASGEPDAGAQCSSQTSQCGLEPPQASAEVAGDEGHDRTEL